MKNPIIKLLMLTILVGTVTMSYAQPPLMKTLDNGMIAVVKENHNAPIVTIHVFVKTGSIHEEEYLGAGISHYFEHLAGDGTKTRTKQEIERIDEELGNAANAYTSKNVTGYYRTTAAQNFEKALDLTLDGVFNATFPEEEVETQRGIILNEIRHTYDDIQHAGWNFLYETMFLVHPTRYPVIGYEELFKGLTRDDILKYYQKRYVPENTVLVVVGDVDAQRAMETIEQMCEQFPRRTLLPVTIPTEPPQNAPRRAIKGWDTKLVYLYKGFHTVPYQHPDLYPLDVLSYILSNGDSSRLVKKIKDQRGLVSAISTSSYTPNYDGGIFLVYAEMKPEFFELAEKAIMEELELVTNTLVTEQELEVAKKQKLSDYYFQNQRVEDQARSIGYDVMAMGDPDYSKVYVENINRVTAEDILRVAKKYLKEDNMTTTALVPKEMAQKLEKETYQAKKSSISDVSRHRLSNGITLLTKENSIAPTVEVRIYFNAGLRVEDEKVAGINNFMARMLKKGTTSRTAQDIASLVDSLGAKLWTEGGYDSFGVHASFLAEDSEIMMDLLADIIMYPAFSLDEIEKEKKVVLNEIQRYLDDPWGAAFSIFLEKNFKKGHPYSRIKLGTEKGIKRIDQSALFGFHSKYCVPDNMVMAIFGDINERDMKKLVDNEFADFKAINFKPPRFNRSIHHTKNEVFIEKLDKAQAFIFFGFEGINRKEKDRYDLMLLDAVLSGMYMPGGRLHDRLRNSQLVYAIHAYDAPLNDKGYFGIYAASAPEEILKTRDIILEELERIKSEPVPDDELQRGKNMVLTAKMVYGSQTNGDQAEKRATDELFGLGYKNFDDLEKRINSLEAKDVMQAAKKYLNNYTMVIITSKPELAK